MPALPLVTGCGCYGDSVERRRRSRGHPQYLVFGVLRYLSICRMSASTPLTWLKSWDAHSLLRTRRGQEGPAAAPLCPQHAGPRCRTPPTHFWWFFSQGFDTLPCYLASITTVSAPSILVCLAQSFLRFSGATHSKDCVQRPLSSSRCAVTCFPPAAHPSLSSAQLGSPPHP